MDAEYFKQFIQPTLPHQAGVYKFIGKSEQILYVGKAKSLIKRVSSYFTGSRKLPYRIQLMVKKADQIEFTVVDSEQDALLLENNLIKEYQPKYNVLLKDGKSYASIVIKNEPFPRILTTRKRFKDGSEYFGPFTSLSKVRTLLDFIRETYQIRTCKLDLSQEQLNKNKHKVCLEYHIGKCKGPCEQLQSEEHYNQQIIEIRQILKGNISEVIKQLKQEIQKKAENLEFESAHWTKKKLDKIQDYQSKSVIVSETVHNVDVFNWNIDEDGSVLFISFMHVEKGSIVQATNVHLDILKSEDKEQLLSFGVSQIIERFNTQAEELILPEHIVLEEVQYKNIHIPQRGDKKKLIDLAYMNVRAYRKQRTEFSDNIKEHNKTQQLLETLQEDFRLTQKPKLIECFDNSNLQGSNPVASMVVMRNGKLAKSEYRRFTIKSVEGPDDFASMEEIIYRRYKRVLEEGLDLADLIVVDGGKGQLSSAVKSLKELGLYGKVAIAGIAKRLEEIYVPDDPHPIYIDKRSVSLRAIQHLRDEAHRFAITFHRQKRSKQAVEDPLDGIKGLGKASKAEIWKHFKTTEEILAANQKQLEDLIGKNRAKILLTGLQQKKEE